MLVGGALRRAKSHEPVARGLNIETYLFEVRRNPTAESLREADHQRGTAGEWGATRHLGPLDRHLERENTADCNRTLH